ncbi:hypothetical protein ACUN0C_01960 [Faunimonas sp. B44]|uniref:hypothetical protein n=1 Tax=Faunimonas sp. B44 TaxID=3461493 RepID=UPI0040439CF3
MTHAPQAVRAGGKRILRLRGLAAHVKDLWFGRLPLRVTFWEYAIVYGLLVNVVATGAALISYSERAPGPVAVALFLIPAAYFLVVTVGVFRSAAAYRGRKIWAELARAATVAWALWAVII